MKVRDDYAREVGELQTRQPQASCWLVQASITVPARIDQYCVTRPKQQISPRAALSCYAKLPFGRDPYR